MGKMAGPGAVKHSKETIAMVKFSTDMILDSLASSTLTSYSKVIKDYTHYIYSLEEGLFRFPATPVHVNLFASHLFQKGYAPSTITTRVSAIAFWHKMYGYEDPTEHFLVRRNLLCMKHKKPQIDPRPPLLLSDLHKLVDAVQAFGWSAYTQSLIRAMLLVSFHAFLRPGEMTKSINSIQFSNILVTKKFLKIKLFRYKHSKGKSAILKVKAVGSSYCPVRALSIFLVHRGDLPGNLFCDVFSRPVSYNWYSKIFKMLVLSAKINHAFRPHCARIGAATQAAINGVPEDQIKRMGRWISSAYGKYLRLPEITM
jgi:site-specific recombinase XerD